MSKVIHAVKRSFREANSKAKGKAHAPQSAITGDVKWVTIHGHHVPIKVSSGNAPQTPPTSAAVAKKVEAVAPVKGTWAVPGHPEATKTFRGKLARAWDIFKQLNAPVTAEEFMEHPIIKIWGPPPNWTQDAAGVWHPPKGGVGHGL